MDAYSPSLPWKRALDQYLLMSTLPSSHAQLRSSSYSSRFSGLLGFICNGNEDQRGDEKGDEKGDAQMDMRVLHGRKGRDTIGL